VQHCRINCSQYFPPSFEWIMVMYIWKRNARASPCVLLVFSWNGINVIFLIKKLHLCHLKRYRCNILITSMSLQENTRRCSSISHIWKDLILVVRISFSLIFPFFFFFFCLR
jgi:hypothetical protein